MQSQDDKHRTFRTLHERPGAFVIPNPWDAGTARILATMGFEALATTSAGYAFSVGKPDSAASLTRAGILENARQIVEATDLPVSADLENGFGDAPEDCATTTRAALDVGLVGGSIEDATGNAVDPIYPFELAVVRVAAAVEAARGKPFVLTARAENFLWDRPDIDDTIRRLQAFSAAGADVLYAPGLPDLEAIRTVCRSVDKPVNVVMGLRPPIYTLAELEAVGVKRVSVGGALARTALAAFKRAAIEIREHGTFSFSISAVPDKDASAATRGTSESRS